jgi:hypothetical protein
MVPSSGEGSIDESWDVEIISQVGLLRDSHGSNLILGGVHYGR